MTQVPAARTSRVRARAGVYASAAITAVSALVFLSTVTFLPASPVLPILVAAGLGAVCLRETNAAQVVLYLLAFFSVFWQLFGFGFFQQLSNAVGLAVVFALLLPLLVFVSRRVEATSMALGILAVGLMLTPQYYLSVPVIVVAAMAGGLGNIAALSVSFALLLAPFLLLENAIYFTTSSAGAAAQPIVFDQLVHLTSNLRPAIPGINVVFTGIPQGYVSPNALAVSRFLVDNGAMIITPVFVLAFALLLSASLARLAKSLLTHLSIFDKARGLIRMFTPLVVSVVIAAVFVVFVSAFSLPGVAGFQTFNGAPLASSFLVAASVAVGSSYTGMDLVVRKLERIEVARSALVVLLSEVEEKVKEVGGVIDETSKLAPSVNLSPERKVMSEYLTYTADARARMEAVGLDSISQWTRHLELDVLPALTGMPQRLKSRVADELRVLASVALTVNGVLDEAGLQTRYSGSIAVPDASASDEETIRAYETAISEIRQTTTSLFNGYISTAAAYNRLMGSEVVTPPPVSPIVMLDSNNYVMAMTLASEEYWLKFTLGRTEEFSHEKGVFLSFLERLRGTMASEDEWQEDSKAFLDGVSEVVSNARPPDAPTVLQKMDELTGFLRAYIQRGLDELETVRKMIAKMGSTVADVLNEQVAQDLDRLTSLQQRLLSIEPAFGQLVDFGERALPVLESHITSRRKGEERLIIISHYPVARRLLQGLLPQKGSVRVSDLPFKHEPAVLYAKIFAASSPNRSFRYDDRNEVISVSHA